MSTHHFTGPAPRATCSGERPTLCTTDWELVDCGECLIRRTHIDEAERDAHRRAFRWKGNTGCLTAALHDFAVDMKHPMYNFHSLIELGAEPDDMYRDAALAVGVDLNDDNWDDTVLPVEIPAHEVDPDDYCAACMVRFRDGASVRHVTVLLMKDERGDAEAIGYLGYVPGLLIAGIPGAPDLIQANVTAASVHEAKERALEMFEKDIREGAATGG